MQTELTDYGRVTFFFGIFCAYWAQTTERSAWVWFFLGLIFGPLASVVLLHLNARDRASGAAAP